MTALLIIGVITGLIGWAFFWLNLNSPVQTRIPAILWPISIICFAVALGMLLAGCTPTPSPVPPTGSTLVYDKCGVPYTDAENKAGIEHFCPEPRS